MMHPSTPIYLPSTVTTIEDWLISLREGSHAPHFLQQENVSEKLTIEICGPKPLGLYGKYDQNTSSWKMSEDWLMGLTPTQKRSLGTFPRQGTMHDGVCVPQNKLELHTKDSGGGVSQTGVMFPTPANQEPGWKHITIIDAHGCEPPCHPNQRFYNKKTGRLVQKGLTQMAAWPTPDSSARGPNAMDLVAENGKSVVRRNSRQKRGINLETATKFATPQNRDYRIGERSRWENTDRSRNLNDQVGGSLNPDWVEWIMGVPLGWTSMNSLTQKNYKTWLNLSRQGMWWANEPTISRLINGGKNRNKRLKALGNGIVPATLTGFLCDNLEGINVRTAAHRKRLQGSQRSFFT